MCFDLIDSSILIIWVNFTLFLSNPILHFPLAHFQAERPIDFFHRIDYYTDSGRFALKNLNLSRL